MLAALNVILGFHCGENAHSGLITRLLASGFAATLVLLHDYTVAEIHLPLFYYENAL
jgi:hypothetical protein